MQRERRESKAVRGRKGQLAHKACRVPKEYRGFRAQLAHRTPKDLRVRRARPYTRSKARSLVARLRPRLLFKAAKSLIWLPVRRIGSKSFWASKASGFKDTSSEFNARRAAQAKAG